jgi:hypothetical protein
MRHAPVVLVALAIAGCGGHAGAAHTDAGADAQVAAPPLTREEIAHACVNAFACLAPPIDGPTLPNCLRHLDDGDRLVSMYRPEQIRCLVAAGADCVAARACVGYTYGPCAPDGDHCEGDRLVQCSRGAGLSLDCRHGLWYTGDTTCVAGRLVECGISACAPDTPYHCEGSRVMHCIDGVLDVQDCAAVDANCVDEGGFATCVAKTTECTETAARCEGTNLIRCGGGRELRYACAEMFDGGMCLNEGRDGASCAFGPSCGDSATCAGNVTQLCVLGAQVSIDCIASGFGGCDLGSCLPKTFP